MNIISHKLALRSVATYFRLRSLSHLPPPAFFQLSKRAMARQVRMPPIMMSDKQKQEYQEEEVKRMQTMKAHTIQLREGQNAIDKLATI